MLSRKVQLFYPYLKSRNFWRAIYLFEMFLIQEEPQKLNFISLKGKWHLPIIKNQIESLNFRDESPISNLLVP